MSGATASTAAYPSGGTTPTPPVVTNLALFAITNLGYVESGAKSGVGDSFAFASPNLALTDSAGLFDANDLGERITIAGSGVPGNNGSFSLVSVTPTNIITANNTGGGVEAVFPGTWALGGRFNSLTELVAARAFSQATDLNRPAVVNDLAPGKKIWMKSPTNVQWLQNVSAPFASQFQSGNVSVSVRLLTNPAFTSWLAPGFTIGFCAGSFAGNYLFFRLNATTAQCAWNDGALTTLSFTHGLTINDGLWHSYGWAFNAAARTMQFFRDGVSIGTSAAGTARTPTGFDTCELGANDSEAVGTAHAGCFFGFAAGNSVLWNAADFLAIHNSFVAYGSPP